MRPLGPLFLLALTACSPSMSDVEVPSVPSPATPTPVPEPPPAVQPGTGALVRPVELADEPVWCWTFLEENGLDVLTAIGTTTGRMVPMLTVALAASSVQDATVHQDGFILTAGAGLSQRVDLVTGEVETHQTDPLLRGVGTWNDALIRLHVLDQLAVFVDFDAMTTGDGVFPEWESDVTISRFDVDGDLMYGALHADRGVFEIDPSTGLILRPILLDGFDGWFRGLSVEAGVIHVLTDVELQREIRRFDLEGNHLSTLELPDRANALFCDSIPTEDIP